MTPEEMRAAGYVRIYGCVLCQREHREGCDPEFEPHLHHQSKHGYRWIRADRVYFALNAERVEADFHQAIECSLARHN